jgi:hypothetical protein
MVESGSQKEEPDRSLFICMYCDKYRNDAGYWEKVYKSHALAPAARISHGICPRCYQEHFPDEYSSSCEEGEIAVREKIMPDSRLLFGCFFIVSNKGFLFGDYDKRQRL